MTRTIGALLIASSGLLVAYAEGFHWIAVWNLMPLALAMAAIVRGTAARPLKWSVVAFAGVTTLLIALTHAAWVFDWGGTQTGSSTAGLIFLFSPIYSILLGTAVWAVTRGIERLRGK
jgi:fucose 4-O-acetylase-like acetyltransferase